MNGDGVKVVIFYYFVAARAKFSRFFISAAGGSGVSDSRRRRPFVSIIETPPPGITDYRNRSGDNPFDTRN